MNIRKYIYLMPAVLLMGLTACSVDEHKVALEQDSPKVPQLTADVVEGQLLVRFDSRVSDILDKAGLTKSGPKMPMDRSGILSVDEILDLVDGYQIERVFPADVRSEDKARSVRTVRRQACGHRIHRVRTRQAYGSRRPIRSGGISSSDPALSSPDRYSS